MNKNKLFLFIPLFLFLSCQNNSDQKLTIAAAANMQFAMKALVEAFTEETNIECETIISSSGKLTAQIIHGAPYHIFVSADLKYPNTLFEKGKTIAAPKVYAYGYLVLWSQVGAIENSLETVLQSFPSEDIQHIALANPKTAPYGRAAMQVLEKDQAFSSYESKLVYGESIAQVNQFVTTKAAEFGFTAKSVVMAPKINPKGDWLALPTDLYDPIEQGVVILKTNPKAEAQAQKFYKFLFSPKAKEILDNFGYDVEME